MSVEPLSDEELKELRKLRPGSVMVSGIDAIPRLIATIDFERNRCHDCDVRVGFSHADGCDVARCTVCGYQRIGCEHGGSDVGWGEVWTGEWPGTVECREYDLWCKWSDTAGWLKCEQGEPGATEDLNTLMEMAHTGQVTWNGNRWVKP